MSPSVALSLLFALQVSASTFHRRTQSDGVSPRTGFILNWDLLDWHEASKACQAWNWSIAFPSTPAEGETLLSFLVNLSDNSTKDIHLGFHSMFLPRHYVTMQGRDMDKVGFWQWDPTSENRTDQRCGALTVAGMKTIDCNTRQESVCEFKESLYYDKVEGFGYYRFHDLTWNWTDAVATCKIQSANLLLLHSTDEYDAIFNYFSEVGFVNGSIDLLYGAHQMFEDKLYLTLADEPLEDSGYDVWAPGEPGDVTGADFPLVGLRLTNLTTSEAEAGMFALPSGTPLQFICKRDLH